MFDLPNKLEMTLWGVKQTFEAHARLLGGVKNKFPARPKILRGVNKKFSTQVMVMRGVVKKMVIYRELKMLLLVMITASAHPVISLPNTYGISIPNCRLQIRRNSTCAS